METIKKDGIIFPVLNVDKKGYVICPFCGQKHKHGKGGGDGHRIPDCNYLLIKSPLFTKDGWCERSNGYFVRFS